MYLLNEAAKELRLKLNILGLKWKMYCVSANAILVEFNESDSKLYKLDDTGKLKASNKNVIIHGNNYAILSNITGGNIVTGNMTNLNFQSLDLDTVEIYYSYYNEPLNKLLYYFLQRFKNDKMLKHYSIYTSDAGLHIVVRTEDHDEVITVLDCGCAVYYELDNGDEEGLLENKLEITGVRAIRAGTTGSTRITYRGSRVNEYYYTLVIAYRDAAGNTDIKRVPIDCKENSLRGNQIDCYLRTDKHDTVSRDGEIGISVLGSIPIGKCLTDPDILADFGVTPILKRRNA